MTAKRTTTKTRRAKAEPADVQPTAGRAAEGSVEELLDGIFASVASVAQAKSAVPEVIRKNRRGRAKRRLVDALEARGPYPVTEALRGELRTLAERWAQKDFEDAFPEADEFEMRCADERAVLDAEARGDEEERFAAAEHVYHREIERNYGRIEIRGLQLSARVHQDLEIAYVPLHVEESPDAWPTGAPKKTAGKKPKAGAKAADARTIATLVRALVRSRVPVTQALAKHPRLLLVGDPGSGKSTLVAYLATCAARGELAVAGRLKAALIPFVVPVRSLLAVPATVEAVARAAGAETWFLEAALHHGRALLLVDGLDEARSEVVEQVLPAFTTILDAHPGSRVLITTRPAGAPGENEPVPQGFARVRLLPMTREEVGTFIDRWCLAAELSLAKPRTQAEADARAAAEDLKERVRASRAIEKLAQTPLLCSVVCVVHRFLGQRIPERRVALYEAITNVLLYEWDRAKFPEGAAIGKLDAHAKRALLARLARFMHESRVAELPAAAVIERLAAHLPALGHRAEEAEAIVAEIRDRNGVLVERAPGLFAFSHLTFQEYLAAMELVNARAYTPMLRRYQDEWWHEVIVLAAGFPGADAERIVRGLLDNDGGLVAEGTMLAAQCAETAVELGQSLRIEIEKQVAKLIPPKSEEEFRALIDLGDIAGPVLLRMLDRADAEGKAPILRALGAMAYEPAASAVGRFLKDPSKLTQQISISDAVIFDNLSITEWAALAAVILLEDSKTAFSHFLQTMPDADPQAILALRMLKDIRKRSGRYETADRIAALIERYEATHPEAASSAALASKRAARSG